MAPEQDMETERKNIVSMNDPLLQFRGFLEQIDLDRAASSPQGTKIEVPLDIVMSLLRPDELEKLKNYITSYFRKRDGSEVK